MVASIRSRHQFVAGDLLSYPVEGDPLIRSAPDVLVVFGRPKGYRGSYKQWLGGEPRPRSCSKSSPRKPRGGDDSQASLGHRARVIGNGDSTPDRSPEVGP